MRPKKSPASLPGSIQVINRSILAPSPMTGMPIMTPVPMRPMTRHPDPARMRWLCPVTANSNIRPVPCFPLFVDPDVTRARSDRPYHRMPNRTNRYINLSGSGVGERPCTHYHCEQKCQFYKFLLHMLVFKFTNWTSKLLIG